MPKLWFMKCLKVQVWPVLCLSYRLVPYSALCTHFKISDCSLGCHSLCFTFGKFNAFFLSLSLGALWVAYPFRQYNFPMLYCSTELSSTIFMPSFIASCNFILPPLLHSFSITGLQNLCKGFPALVTNTAGTRQSPHNCYSIQSLGLLINENSDNQGWFWVTLISACSASSGANCSLLMWLSSFIPCRYLEALYSDLKITLAWFSVRSTVPVGKNLCAVIG